MSYQAQLVEVCQQKQKLEDSLRQRERELTALKGALKDEVANHDREMEALREQYSADMEKLRSSMEQVSQVCVRVCDQLTHKLRGPTATISPASSVTRVSISTCYGSHDYTLGKYERLD